MEAATRQSGSVEVDGRRLAWRSAGSGPPLLLVNGTADLVIPPENATALAAHWADSRVERFPGCGHALMAQEPQRFADLVTTFTRE